MSTQYRTDHVPQHRSALRRSEFAERVGISVTTVDRLIRDGQLRAVKCGRAVLVPASEEARFLGTAA